MARSKEKVAQAPRMVIVATLLSAGTLLLAAMTLAPLVPQAHGLVRVCDFPRLQIMVAAIVLAILTLVLLPMVPALVLLAVQGAVGVAQAGVCLRYTPLWRKQSISVDTTPDDRSMVSIVTANVKMSNDRYSSLSSIIETQDPDIVILMEVDDRWLAALSPVTERFPFKVERPQDDSYGMALYSKLPLVDPQVRFLILPEVPSIRTMVALSDGRRFALYVLHPEPPVPFEDTLGRDGELILTAQEVRSEASATIVAGDLNDVAWSRTTRRFQRLSGLLDPRIGRGLFSSFDARYPFLRWPLDHLFHDARFRLVRLARLPKFGSDHFPMLFALALADHDGDGARPAAPDADDVGEAGEVVREASRLDRPAIGTDWED